MMVRTICPDIFGLVRECFDWEGGIQAYMSLLCKASYIICVFIVYMYTEFVLCALSLTC